MNYLFNESYHSRLKGIGQQWAQHNRLPLIYQLFGLGISASAILVPFDQVFFGTSGLRYLPFRLLTIVTFLIPVLILRRFRIDSTRTVTITFLSGAALIATFYFNLAYIYFFETCPEAHESVVLSAIFMNVFACNLLLHRLWREHYILSFFFLATFAACSFIYPRHMGHYQSFVLWAFIMTLFFWFQRRVFMSALYVNFQTLLHQYSPQAARALVVLGDEKKYLENFAPENRPCVCICIDWRSFQDFCESHAPKEVAEIVEKSHELLLDIVFKNVPTQTFHSDWSADEFFLILYSENNDKDELKMTALHVVSDIQQTFHSMMQREHGASAPTIDIGASFGHAIVGLLGPRNMKKLTTLGDVGGKAKRFQTEAKQIRSESGMSKDVSIVVLGSSLYEFAKTSLSTWASTFESRKAVSRNISGSTVYFSVTKIDHSLETTKKSA